MTDMTDHMMMRLTDAVATAIAAHPDGVRRRHLERGVEIGDIRIDRSEAGIVTGFVGGQKVVEMSVVSLQRPDDPSGN